MLSFAKKHLQKSKNLTVVTVADCTSHSLCVQLVDMDCNTRCKLTNLELSTYDHYAQNTA